MSHVVSAIIVNYNAGPLLGGSVDSLLACPLAVEVIVVDNASDDGSLDGLPDSQRIRVIRNTTNVGFAAACNLGMQASSAPSLPAGCRRKKAPSKRALRFQAFHCRAVRFEQRHPGRAGETAG